MSYTSHIHTSQSRSSEAASIITGRSDCFESDGALNQMCDLIIGNNSISETRKFYNVWASNFEADMEEAGYRGPEILVQYLKTTLKLPKSAKILDVGCGTGLVGVELKKNGQSWNRWDKATSDP